MGRAPITIKQTGDFSKTTAFLKEHKLKKMEAKLDQLGQMGVEALSAATPVRTGKTAASWRYVVIRNGDKLSIQWHNDNTSENGDNIVTLLIRGHGTRNGHYYRGNDFVTPAIEPILQEITDKVWAEVTK